MVNFGYKWQARRDSNPQHPDLESGALTVRATGLMSLLFGLLVRRVSLAEPAILLELEPVRSPLLIFRGRVISLLALGAGKGDDVSHNAALFDDIADDAGAHGPAALANRKPKLFLHRDRRDQLNG